LYLAYKYNKKTTEAIINVNTVDSIIIKLLSESYTNRVIILMCTQMYKRKIYAEMYSVRITYDMLRCYYDMLDDEFKYFVIDSLIYQVPFEDELFTDLMEDNVINGCINNFMKRFLRRYNLLKYN
jgi:hypothetical protein